MEFLVTVFTIIACVLLFALAILIHEFGHFVAAKLLGLRVDAFSIGFGPALWKRKIGGVEYRISSIPLGGYVALPDLDPEGTKGVQGTSGSKAVTDLPAWKKIIVAFAGPFGNIVLAVILAVTLALIPSVKFGSLPTVVSKVIEGGPADKGGMRDGDRVISVAGNPVMSWTDMMTEVQIVGDKEVVFVVKRGEETVECKIRPEQNEVTGIWYIKALSLPKEKSSSPWLVDRDPLKQLSQDASSIVRVLKALVTPKEAKTASKAIGGPLMIAEGLYNQVRNSVWDGLGLLRFLNVNLAIVNLLPIPVLDGGLILFALFELLLRRKLSKKFVTVVTSFFMYLLMGLMALLVFRDGARFYKIHTAKPEELIKTTSVDAPAASDTSDASVVSEAEKK